MANSSPLPFYLLSSAEFGGLTTMSWPFSTHTHLCQVMSLAIHVTITSQIMRFTGSDEEQMCPWFATLWSFILNYNGWGKVEAASACQHNCIIILILIHQLITQPFSCTLALGYINTAGKSAQILGQDTARGWSFSTWILGKNLINNAGRVWLMPS